MKANSVSSNRQSRLRSLLLFSMAALLAGSASAQLDPDLEVAATIIAPSPTCSNSWIDNVDFGDLVAGTTVSSTSPPSVQFNLVLDCNGSIPSATVSFDGGQNPQASTGISQMGDTGGSGATIQYGLLKLVFAGQQAVLPGVPITLNLTVGTNTEPFTAILAPSQVLPSTVGSYMDTQTVTYSF